LSSAKDRAEREERIRSLAVELRLLEGAVQELQARIGIINASIRELTITNMTIEGLSNLEKGAEILVPIGSGSYAKARLEDVEKVIMGIGAGVATEKPLDEARRRVEEQLAELQKLRASLEGQLIQTIERAEAIRSELQKILSSERG